jgi:hypothetical protein
MSGGMLPLVHGYDELRVRIDRRDAGSYHVLASTPSAEASTSFELPFGDLEIGNFILRVSHPRGRRRLDSSAIAEARQFGGRLFRALFRGDIYDLYRHTLSLARGQGRGVRITLCLSGSPELIDVPWEYLYDEPDFLAVSAFTPVVRYLDLPRAHRPLQVETPLRLLGVVTNPAEYERLDVDRERANLERALSGLTGTGAVELVWLERPTLGGLLQALQSQTFHALHYIGHGLYDHETEQGLLVFEDDSGWARPVSGDQLGMVLHDFSSLRLAVLNACEGARAARNDPFAGVAGALVRRDIPAVVAMQFEISDEAAIVFASGLYQSIAGGAPVDASLAAARLAILAERSDDIEWGTPVLFMRVPDGRIFDLDGHVSLPGQPRPAKDGRASRGPVAAVRPGPPLDIFINYRREDTSGHALLLTDRLGQHFGHERVHVPIDHRSGVDNGQLPDTAVFLALIGPGWASSLKNAKSDRRAEDVARREIESALRDLPDRVIPVLIDANMPDPETLPRSLRGLCRKESAELRHSSFDQDVTGLIKRLERAARTRLATEPLQRSGQVTTAARPVTSAATRTQTAGGIPRPYLDHHLEVIDGMLDGGVVPLLGPGVRGASVTADDLGGPLAEQFNTHSAGLPEVAQRVAVTLGERQLYGAVKNLVELQSEPSDVHRFLAELPGLARQMDVPAPRQLIISANYDSGLERAFEDANEPFDYAVYIADSGWFVHVPWGEDASGPVATTIVEPRRYVEFPIDDDGQLQRTIIVKIHGGADGREGDVVWRNNYVVTEDHYIDYLPTHNIQDHLPIQILDKLTGSRCLFLGYPLRSWNARVFLRRIWRGNPISENSWAVEREPDLLEKASWSAIGRVELLADSLPDYVNALRSVLLDRPGRH